MKQRTAYTLTVEIEILQDVADDATKAELLENLSDIKNSIEINVSKALIADGYFNEKVYMVSFPKFS